ncbi:MAG: DNA-processing protein DprA [Candidatus Methylomirabilia bacterium]
MGAREEQDRWSQVAARVSPAPTAPQWGGAVEEQRARAERVGARLVLLDDSDYPAQLRAIPSPPAFLFVRGEIRAEDSLAVAVVGSRRATLYGLHVAERLAGDLVARGITVVSGLARGVDTAAHRGALARGGRTIAVLGSGADVIYPPENRALASQIIGRGALVSQLPMGTPPLARHFPVRNRTIAGLALGTVVVEAGEESGALITAGHAGELGREVFAVPGNITTEMSRGVNRLIQDGAKLVQGWGDIVSELPEVWRQCLVDPDPERSRRPLDGDGRRLLELIGLEPVNIERLIEQSGVPAGRLAALLSSLELDGWVRQLPGKMYIQVSSA